MQESLVRTGGDRVTVSSGRRSLPFFIGECRAESIYRCTGVALWHTAVRSLVRVQL
jgi:hypothetical protein